MQNIVNSKYKYIVYYFISIIVLVPFGFRRYFAAILTNDSQSWILHFHTIVMTIWCLILIAQPILISRKQNAVHKQIGNFSLILVPIILISIWLVLRHSFYRMELHIPVEENIAQLFFPFSQMVLFGVFYLLAMLNKHKPKVHMRYIIVSSVSLLGPTIGRINFNPIGLGHLDMDLWIMNLVLIGFIVSDLYRKVKLSPYYFGLGAYALAHWGYYTFSETKAWMIIAEKALIL